MGSFKILLVAHDEKDLQGIDCQCYLRGTDSTSAGRGVVDGEHSTRLIVPPFNARSRWNEQVSRNKPVKSNAEVGGLRSVECCTGGYRFRMAGGLAASEGTLSPGVNHPSFPFVALFPPTKQLQTHSHHHPYFLLPRRLYPLQDPESIPGEI